MISLGRNTRTRRGDRAARDANVPMASGTVAAANPTLVGVRMTRRSDTSGASWGRAGGTGVLAFLKSDRLDAAWSRMAVAMATARDCPVRQ